MKIYPAIDLKSGQCVRLHQGSFDQVTAYNNDPLSVAKDFAKQGATHLHVVDLDGAKSGQSAHTGIIVQIARETNLQLQVGGGIRTQAQIETLLEQGISRVILGSVAMLQPDLVKQWLEIFGADKIVLALDVRLNEKGEPQLASHGWQSDTHISLWDLLDTYGDTVSHILCTDIDCDGTLQGPNIALYEMCQSRYPHLQFQASGGIGTLDDLKKLAKIPVAGVVIGKALYEERFTLADVFLDREIGGNE